VVARSYLRLRVAGRGEPQREWEEPRTIKEKPASYRKQLMALGNAVVPQTVYPIAVAIRQLVFGGNKREGRG
jgi:hypothetical protein